MKRLICLLLLIPLFLNACGSSDSEEDRRPQLRVVHASPDAPNVDVYLDGELLLSNVPYQTVSSYFRLEVGERNLQLNISDTDTTVLDLTSSFEENREYSAIASNLVSELTPILTNDDLSNPGAGESLLRIGHLAPGAPDVDVYVSNLDADLETLEPVLSNVAFSELSDYLQLPAGTYQLRFTVAGTTFVAIDSGELTFQTSSIYTAYALDAPGGGEPFSLEMVRDR